MTLQIVDKNFIDVFANFYTLNLDYIMYKTKRRFSNGSGYFVSDLFLQTVIYYVRLSHTIHATTRYPLLNIFGFIRYPHPFSKVIQTEHNVLELLVSE